MARYIAILIYCVICLFISIQAGFPRCYRRGVWEELAEHYLDKDGSENGFPEAESHKWCSYYCRTQQKYTFYGVTRSGERGSYTRCYCGDDLWNLTPAENCTYTCDTLLCGNSLANEMSVFPVCPNGTFGSNGFECSRSCRGPCMDGVCNVTNADCFLGCEAGWTGPQCEQHCPPTCFLACTQDTGECTDGCLPGFYGDFCQLECPTCSGGCDHNATCLAGCKGNNSHGERCEIPCSEGCSNHSCFQDDGECDHGCRQGFYSVECNETCSHCLGGCLVTGSCIDGCVQGYYGTECDLACSGCDGGCDQYTGECIKGCPIGYFGEKCDRQCPWNCLGMDCEKDSGVCLDGCKDKWFGPHCTSPCSPGCNSSCAWDDGFCTPCVPGWYGRLCETPCPEDCLEDDCVQISGECTTCAGGYFGRHCEKRCSSGCADSVCDKYDGQCTGGCRTGWSGDDCTQGGSTSSSSSPRWALAVTAIILLIVGLAAGCGCTLMLLHWKSLSKSSNTYSSNEDDSLESQKDLDRTDVCLPGGIQNKGGQNWDRGGPNRGSRPANPDETKLDSNMESEI